MRAFLQRSEVRLSTMHRVATALLSGAGILVLLPALERDAVTLVMRAMVAGPISWSRALLALAVAVSIALVVVVLWFVLVELTRFYFHANHVESADGSSFTPRFTLTGLRIPIDELSPAGNTGYVEAHTAGRNIRLLVPSNPRARTRIDHQIDAYPGLTATQPGAGRTDLDRAEALFELAASRRRTLVDEVAKVEYGIARHMLRLQVIVMRYVKALLVVIITAVSIFACSAAIQSSAQITAADERWVAGSLLLWAPMVIFVAAQPVHWLESLLRSEGARHTAVRKDHELVRLEDLTSKIATVTWVAAAVSMVTLLVRHPVSPQGVGASVAALAGSALGLAGLALRRYRSSR